MPGEIPTLDQAALELAKLGYAVFPCKPRGKSPLTTNGFKGATRDLDQIGAWWTRWPDANIGIATGAMSGVLVVDVDGEAGESKLAELEVKYGQLPATGGVKTGKGRHLYLAIPEGSGKIPSPQCDGIDIRCDGAYVIAPPSVHESGAVYSWDPLTGDGDFAAAPDWLIEFAQEGKSRDGKNALRRVGDRPSCKLNASQAARDGTKSLHSALSNVTAPAAPPSEDQEVPRLVTALAAIPAGDRDVWRNVGMALFDTGWPNARVGWDAWSRSAPDKFDEAGQDAAWVSFGRPYSGPRVTLATIYAMAKERGWTDPTRPLAALNTAPPATTGGAAEVAPTIAPKAEVDFARFPPTDAGNGEAYLAVYGESVRYVEAWGSWLVWNGMRWVETSALAMLPYAVHLARQMGLWAQRLNGETREKRIKHALATERDVRLSAMLKLASSGALIRPDALDADGWLLGCPNGTLDLRTGRLREARREDLITKAKR